MEVLIGTRSLIGEQAYEEMLRLRRKIFCGRLQWDIPSVNPNPELEEDAFDAPGTVYVLLGAPIVACCRLIPTNQQTMISVLWPDVMDAFQPSSATWELSRFAVDKDAKQPIYLSAKLLLESYKFALEQQISHYVVISTPAAAKVIRRMGVDTVRLPSLDETIVPSSTKITFEVGAVLQAIVDSHAETKVNISPMAMLKKSQLAVAVQL